MNPQAFIFDFDGVLVDSERAHWELYQEVLGPLGAEFSWEEYAGRWMALHDAGCIGAVLAERGIAVGGGRIEELVASKARLFAARLASGGFPLFPGARELVEELSDSLPLAICSGALRPEIEAVLKAHGLRGHFGPIVAAEDSARHKPDPTPYKRAFAELSRLSGGGPPLDRSRCVAIEDTPGGIASAKAAGLVCLGVCHSHPAERLEAADAIVPALAGLDLTALKALLGP